MPRRAMRLCFVRRRAAALLAVAAGAVGCGGAEATRGESAGVASASPSLAVPVPMRGPEAVRASRLLQGFVELDLRDSAYQFRAVLERNNGRVDTVDLPMQVVEDTSVVRLVEGRVQPVDAGQTRVYADLNIRLRLRGVVGVQDRIFADTVRLLPGQVRAWDLRPGWHRITVTTDTRPDEPQRLELAADLLCVPDSRGPHETIVCRVRQNTRMLLRHTGVGDPTDAASAVVTILRTPR